MRILLYGGLLFVRLKQWGRVFQDGGTKVYFPIAYSQTCLSIQLTEAGATAPESINTAGFWWDNVDNSGFIIYASSAVNKMAVSVFCVGI